MFKEECAECGKVLDDTTPCRGFAHTDVFLCDVCFYSDQPERLNPEAPGKGDVIV